MGNSQRTKSNLNRYVGKPREPRCCQRDDAEAPTISRAIQAFSSSIT